MRYYTGVGSRETPEGIQKLLRGVSERLAVLGYVLRSGGTDGADRAFQDGWWNCTHEMSATAEIYIPWNGFNDLSHGQWDAVYCLDKMDQRLVRFAETVAADIHPAWNRLKQGAKKLHTRNIFQVLGKDLDTPSSFLICYAPPQGDSIKGGTRTAWEVAKHAGVRRFNLYNDADRQRLENWMEG